MLLKHKNRGSLIGAVISFGAILVFTLGFLTLSHRYRFVAMEKLSHLNYAEDAGFSSIHKALQHYKNGNFSYAEDTAFEHGASHSTLTFWDGENPENRPQGPYSTNNLSNSSPVVGWNNRIVPGNSVHLVAVGHHGLAHRVVELMAANDSFPWSVASNGSITGKDMEVYAVLTSDDINAPSAGSSLDERKKLRSHILSNAPGGSTLGSSSSIFLTGESLVTGNAQTVGSVGLRDASEVRGDVLEGDEQRREITLSKTASDYSPRAEETNVWGPTVRTISGKWEVTGNAAGEVTIGDLEFDDGYLYVRKAEGAPDVKVTVTGAITGNGAIVSEGDIEILGSMNTTSDLAALVADGDITIDGSANGGVNSSSFNGLILAKGSFSAKDVTLHGSVLSLDATGNVNLERVRAVSVRNLTEIDFSYAVELKRAVDSNFGGSGSSGTGGSSVIGVLYTNPGSGEENFVILDPEFYQDLEALAQAVRDSGGSGSTQVVVRRADGSYSDVAPASLRQAFYAARTSWNIYQNEVLTDTVRYTEVFQLDFNKFLRSFTGFRPLFSKSRPYYE